MSSLEALFCYVDNFCTSFEPRWHSQLLFEGCKSLTRARRMSLSEIMTILITFHQNQIITVILNTTTSTTFVFTGEMPFPHCQVINVPLWIPST